MKIARWLALVVVASGLVMVAPAAEALTPANDTSSAASVVSSLPFAAEQDTAGATDDNNVLALSCGIGATVWYRFTAPQSGPVVAETRGSSFDTVLALYDGYGGVPSAYTYNCSDDTARQRSAVAFDAQAGRTYFFRVGGFLGATGHLKFAVNQGGTLSGVIRDGRGAGVPGACVFADVPGRAFGNYRSATASPTGFYVLGGLPSGEYRPRFTGCAGSGTQRSIAAPAYVAEGRVTRADLVIDQGYAEGVVRERATNGPVGGACVEAMSSSDFDQGEQVNTTVTGYYRFALAPGSYTFRFADCTGGRLAPSYYDDASDTAHASPVTLTAGVTASNINASLQPGATLAGTITDDLTHAPVPSCVTVLRASDGSYLNSGGNFASTTGFYRIGGLPADGVNLRVSDCTTSTPTHAAEWFNDSGDRAGATVLSLIGGTTKTANVSVGKGATMAGVVRFDGSGAPAPNVCVALDNAEGAGGYTYTSATGFYSVNGLPASTFKARFDTCGGHAAPEWYNDRADAASADPISFTSSSTITVNASVAPEGTAHGSAINPATNKGAEVCLNATGSGAAGYSQPSITGAVAMEGLATGRYDLVGYECGPYRSEAGTPTSLGSFDVVAGRDTNLGSLTIPPVDADRDGVTDHLDNCPLTANPGQADANADDLGDVCDVVAPGLATLPKLRVADVSALEGLRDHVLRVHVRLSEPSREPISVRFRTRPVSAETGTDFAATSRTLRFAPGTVDIESPITIFGDRAVEPDERFAVVLGSPTGATIGRGRATITLRNDD